jgi:hypothetical protein
VVDNGTGKREGKFVVRHSHRTAPKKVDYPQEIVGSRLAAKARKQASKLTPEQRRAHFSKGMAMIYGGANAKQADLTRR